MGTLLELLILFQCTFLVVRAIFLSEEPEVARSEVSECTYYNDRHSMGDGTCEGCTSMFYGETRLEEDISNTIAVQEPFFDTQGSKSTPPTDGEYTENYYQLKKQPGPMVKGIYPTAEGQPTPCMWCPETQTCGSPKPADLERPCGSQKFSSRWLPRGYCTVSGVYVQDSYEIQRDIREGQKMGLTPAEKQEYAIQNEHSLALPITTDVREDVNEHMLDSVYECLGKCIDHGVSKCDVQINLLPPAKRMANTLLETQEQTYQTRSSKADAARRTRHRKWSFDDGAAGEATDASQDTSFPINEAAWKEEQEKANLGLTEDARSQAEVAGDNIWAGTYPENGDMSNVLTHMQQNTESGTTTPIPCSLELPANSPSFMRVFGKYTLEKWLDCRLIQCIDDGAQERAKLQEEKAAKVAAAAKPDET